MLKKIIGVFGAANIARTSREWKNAELVGEAIAKAGYVLLTGGLGGAMEAASKGAKEAGGLVVGILPGNKSDGARPNKFVDIAVYTGMGEARNVVNVKSCDAAIAIGGEYGTLSEISLALKAGCPIVLLHSWQLQQPGDELPKSWLEASKPGDAVEKAIKAMNRGKAARKKKG